MSSPLHSLSKKSPSKPLRKRLMPFRNCDLSDDQSLLDDTLQKMTTKHDATISSFDPSSARLGHNTKNTLTKNVPNDMELIATMMKRISQLEIQTQFYSKELIKKDRQIQVLEEKVSLYSQNKEKMENTNTRGQCEDYELKCVQLQNQIYEMESFLADYGMIWVGDNSNPVSHQYLDIKPDSSVPVVSSLNGSWQQSMSFVGSSKIKIDYDLIVRNVRDLNQIAGEGESLIEKTKDGARLKLQDSVPLTLYANGILMFNGPFRTFEDITTQRCMGDLMDGYFPSELQKKYPDGVPIQLTDSRSVFFKDPRKKEIFPGIGRSIGNLNVSAASSVTKSSSTSPLIAEDGEKNFSSSLPGPQLSVEQFLQKLPKNVLKNGQLFDVRGSLKDVLTDNNGQTEQSTEIVDTKAIQEMQERMNLPEETRPVSARNITTIRVKSESGAKTYLLKMKFTDTIGDLRSYINKQRPNHRRQFDIISTFPKQIHTNSKKTLQDSGLVPNAALHLKPKNS